eukprot:sb/3469927/
MKYAQSVKSSYKKHILRVIVISITMFSRFLSKFYHRDVEKLSVGVNTDVPYIQPVDKEEFVKICKIKDLELHRYQRLYRQKASECRDHLERISVFEKQVKERDSLSNEFSESILSKQNIADLELQVAEEYRLFIGKVQSTRYLKAIKNLFIGINYGVVPVVFQHSRLSSTQRKIIRMVNRKSVADIKVLFMDYTKDFVVIFRTVGKTLEFLKTVCCD